jgi:hypothetical protein
MMMMMMMMITGSSWWCHCERGCRMTRGKRNTYMTQHLMLGATRIHTTLFHLSMIARAISRHAHAARMAS